MAGAASKKRNPYLLLDTLDGSRQGRLRHVQGQRRSNEIPAFGHRNDGKKFLCADIRKICRMDRSSLPTQFNASVGIMTNNRLLWTLNKLACQNATSKAVEKIIDDASKYAFQSFPGFAFKKGGLSKVPSADLIYRP